MKRVLAIIFAIMGIFVPVVLDLQSNTIYYQDLQSANIFVVNNFHLMWNERLVKTDSKS